MRKEILGILLTNRCNANCAICGLSCSPKLHDVIDESLMINILDQAKALGTFKRIGFTGGEAFLYPELLIKGSTYAKKLGFVSTVATNGFWGLWSDSKIDAVLSASKLDEVHFSFDAFHHEYISLDAMKNAVRACQRNKIPIVIVVSETRGKYSVNEFFKAIGDFKYLKEFKINSFCRVGRAENLPKEMFYSYDFPKKRCFDLEGMAIAANGTVFPCCSPAVFDTCMNLGNIKEKSLSELLSKGNLINAYRLLCYVDTFEELTEKALSKGIISEEVKKLSPCEICHWIFKTENNVLKLSSDIEKIFDRLLLDVFFKRIKST